MHLGNNNFFTIINKMIVYKIFNRREVTEIPDDADSLADAWGLSFRELEEICFGIVIKPYLPSKELPKELKNEPNIKDEGVEEVPDEAQEFGDED
jgi:hypothetical protein